jgi:nucleoid-associated protein YgaU
MEEQLILPENNLYYKGYIVVLPNGDTFLEAADYVAPTKPKFTLHTVVQGDEITKLAYKYYKGIVPDASKYWHFIANANDLETPWALEIGMVLQIPDVLQLRLLR